MKVGKPRVILKYLRSDLSRIKQSNDSGATKGALIAAAVKSFKSQHYIKWLKRLEAAEGLDMTPRLARKLCGGLFDRKPSTNELQAVWQTANRQNVAHSADFARVDELVERHRAEAEEFKREIEERAVVIRHEQLKP